MQEVNTGLSLVESLVGQGSLQVTNYCSARPVKNVPRTSSATEWKDSMYSVVQAYLILVMIAIRLSTVHR
ncbi:hypothetical protein BDW66DRAFT_138946 [Aspergillus desertorum]